MRRLLRNGLLSPLAGLTLAFVVGAATARAQVAEPLHATARTLGGPADMTNIACGSPPLAIYTSRGSKVCVTLANDAGSGCAVTLALVDFPLTTPPSQSVNPGESVTLCGSKIVTVNTTPGTGTTATYHWRVDGY